MRADGIEGRLRTAIRTIPDFPKPGIQFKDITPVLLDPDLFAGTIDALAEYTEALQADKVVGVDARGFLFAAPVADRLGIGLIPVRKPGKLPFETRRESYALEYGNNTLEIHSDAVEPAERVVVIDDLLATGGTTLAAARLIEALGGQVVGAGFVIELAFLQGRAVLEQYDTMSLVRFE